jgi:hypothetical protein
MPYTPSKVADVTADTVVEYEGDEVAVTYRKRLVRTAAISIFEASPAQQPGRVREALEDVVVEWDVLGEDGEKLPATQDITRKFDFDFLIAIFNGIVSDAMPGESGAAASQHGSSAAATSARVQKSTR